VEAEKQLGISGHPEVTAFGIEKFNDYCRTSVLRYTSEWERYVTRQARWVDFENDYKTLDLPYMESVMWAFKTLHDKGLIYEGFRVLAYCWRCETPLSNTETRMDDVYRDRQDPALTVRFALETGESLLAWTTTPWTLPSNLALAVNPEVDYAILESNGERSILAEARLGAYERELEGAVRVGTVRGAELVGRSYRPLFGYFADTPNAFRVLAGDFVTTEDGTGVVHMAPGFGEDDPIGLSGRRHRRGVSHGQPRVLHRRRHRLGGPARLRGESRGHQAPEGGRCRRAARHVFALVSALLALRRTLGVPRHLLVVRGGHGHQGPHGRTESTDHVGSRAPEGGFVRQVDRQRPRLVHQPQSILGFTHSRVEERRSRLSAPRRLRKHRRPPA